MGCIGSKHRLPSTTRNKSYVCSVSYKDVSGTLSLINTYEVHGDTKQTTAVIVSRCSFKASGGSRK